MSFDNPAAQSHTAIDDVVVAMSGGVAQITLNRPNCRNALTRRMVDFLASKFDELERSERQARAVIIRGAGGDFCAGGDVKEMDRLRQCAEAYDLHTIVEFSASVGHLLRKIERAPVVVIAALEGAVMGGGLGLACVADVVAATRDVRFGMPETALGLVPAQIAPFVRRRIGEPYARLMAVTGGQFDASWGERVGLIHYLEDDPEALDRRVRHLVSRVTSCAPAAVEMSKHLLSAAYEDADPEALGRIFAKTMVSFEAKEGIYAFLEKRRPEWAEATPGEND